MNISKIMNVIDLERIRVNIKIYSSNIRRFLFVIYISYTRFTNTKDVANEAIIIKD